MCLQISEEWHHSNDFLSAVGVSNKCDTIKIQSSVTGNQTLPLSKVLTEARCVDTDLPARREQAYFIYLNVKGYYSFFFPNDLANNHQIKIQFSHSCCH